MEFTTEKNALSWFPKILECLPTQLTNTAAGWIGTMKSCSVHSCFMLGAPSEHTIGFMGGVSPLPIYTGLNRRQNN